MKKQIIKTLPFLLLALSACTEQAPEKEAPEAAVPAVETAVLTNEALVERGAYLVEGMGCDDCHSPKVFTEQGPVPDPARRLSGHPAGEALPEIDPSMVTPGKWVLFNSHNTAAVGPWGVSYAANLTSDPTGLGNWTEANFFKAIREGKYKGLDGSRPLLPPMPWPAFRHLNDEDLRAIFAFLKTVPPVRNIVPAPVAPDQLATAMEGKR